MALGYNECREKNAKISLTLSFRLCRIFFFFFKCPHTSPLMLCYFCCWATFSNEPFFLSLSLLIGQHILTLKSYNAYAVGCGRDYFEILPFVFMLWRCDTHSAFENKGGVDYQWTTFKFNVFWFSFKILLLFFQTWTFLNTKWDLNWIKYVSVTGRGPGWNAETFCFVGVDLTTVSVYKTVQDNRSRAYTKTGKFS